MFNHLRSSAHDNAHNAPEAMSSKAHNAPEAISSDSGMIRTYDPPPGDVAYNTHSNNSAYYSPTVSSEGKIVAVPDYSLPTEGPDGAVQHPGHEKQRICGLKKRTFIIVAALLAVAVIAAIVGGVVAGKKKVVSGGNQDGKTAQASSTTSLGKHDGSTNNLANVNSTMREGSYLAATTGGDDKTYLTEARVFYQDVQKTIRTVYCKGLNVCALQFDSYNFTGAREGTPLAAVGNLETSDKIEVFYIDPDNRLQGKILYLNGSITDDENLKQLKYPDIHRDSRLAAVIYPSNGDIKLWYQQANTGTASSPNCQIQTLVYTKSGGWNLENAVVNSKQGNSLGAITWDGGSSGAEKDRLIRLFYISTDAWLAQYQHSSAAGWSINKPDNNTVPKLILNHNNPILPIVSRSQGRIRPRLEILTTKAPGKVIGTGADEDAGWYLDSNGDSGISNRDPALLYEEGDPMALVFYGVSNGQTIYKAMHHGTDRKLYELVYDGSTMATRAVVFDR
ncbi:hypothetical protein K440DRAFT_659135 [Wilcoxina mikolae CBS 423.85]|nr:hypothetical protein K440DRAFT_659135 [Wilcoxina mikolae CBS 423.85]